VVNALAQGGSYEDISVLDIGPGRMRLIGCDELVTGISPDVTDLDSLLIALDALGVITDAR
jgi:hypothetical protein